MFYYVADLPIEKLQTQVLQLHVFDYDRITRDDSIGEVLLPLWQVLLSVLKLA
jgi:C2 domain.